MELRKKVAERKAKKEEKNESVPFQVSYVMGTSKHS